MVQITVEGLINTRTMNRRGRLRPIRTRTAEIYKSVDVLLKELPAALVARNDGAGVSLSNIPLVHRQMTQYYTSEEKGSEIIIVSFPGIKNGQASEVRFAIKSYRDFSKVTQEEVQREYRIPLLLSNYCDRIVKVYRAIDNPTHTTFIMEDLGSKTLGKFFRDFDREEMDILKQIFASDNWQLDEKDPEREKKSLVLEGLKDSGFTMDDLLTKNWRLDASTHLAEERFELKNGQLVEKPNYLEERQKAFISAIDTVIEFERFASYHQSDVLDNGQRFKDLFPSDTKKERIEKWLAYWKLVSAINGRTIKDTNKLMYLYNEAIDTFKNGLPQYFSIGNCKPNNFIYAQREDGERVSVAIDLYRARKGEPRDISTLLTLGKLTCGLTESDYEACWAHAQEQIKSGEMPRFKKHVNKFFRRRYIIDFDRLSIYYAKACGSVAGSLESPNYNTRKQAEFIINAAGELFNLLNNNYFGKKEYGFKRSIIENLHLSPAFREFVKTYLPADYLAKLDQHNEKVKGYKS